MGIKVVNICAMLTLICLINLSVCVVTVLHCWYHGKMFVYTEGTIKLYIDRIHNGRLCRSVCKPYMCTAELCSMLLCGVVPVAVLISALLLY